MNLAHEATTPFMRQSAGPETSPTCSLLASYYSNKLMNRKEFIIPAAYPNIQNSSRRNNQRPTPSKQRTSTRFPPAPSPPFLRLPYDLQISHSLVTLISIIYDLAENKSSISTFACNWDFGAASFLLFIPLRIRFSMVLYQERKKRGKSFREMTLNNRACD